MSVIGEKNFETIVGGGGLRGLETDHVISETKKQMGKGHKTDTQKKRHVDSKT